MQVLALSITIAVLVCLLLLISAHVKRIKRLFKRSKQPWFNLLTLGDVTESLLLLSTLIITLLVIHFMLPQHLIS